MVINPPSGSRNIRSTTVFEGPRLLTEPPQGLETVARCYLPGINESGQDINLPFSEETFSKHVLFLGSIGAGKTNAIFHIIAQLQRNMAENDVMIVFDTKGDYYSEFFRPGDIVISNDSKATGPIRTDYWNIFYEIPRDETMEENVIEITRTLFYEKSIRSNQPFFPNAARDLLTAILLHHLRMCDPAQMTNLSLRRFLDRSPAAEIRNMLQVHDDLRAIVSYIGDDRSPQTQGVFSELQQMVREILVGNFCKEGSLSVREAVRRKGGRVIFIEYDLGIGNTLTPIYRLLLDLAIKEALNRRKSEGA